MTTADTGLMITSRASLKEEVLLVIDQCRVDIAALEIRLNYMTDVIKRL